MARHRFWLPTLLRSVLRYAARMLAPVAIPGALSSASALATPDYRPLDGMAAAARFPWVYVAVNAVASDMASAPLVARKISQVQGNAPRTVVEDPAVDRLRRPNPTTGGWLFRKQLTADGLLTGNAYIWDTGSALWRLHPHDVTPEIGPLGLIVAYRVRDGVLGTGSQVLPVEEVLHVRDFSWRNDASSALGHSPIATLHDDLLTEYRSRQLAQEQAASGRPDVFITAGEGLGDGKAEELVNAYEKAVRKKHKAFAFGEELKVTPLNYTPRDLEFAARSAMTREAVLAVYEVPPARAGLASANYGTQRQQMRTYIESLIRRACMWNDAFTRLCRPGNEIVHDFSASEALQVARTDQLKRVVLWTTIGATPAAAAAYEGLHDAPVPDGPVDAAAPGTDSRRPDEPQDARRTVVSDYVASVPEEGTLGRAISLALAASAARWEAAVGDVEPGLELRVLQRWEAESMFSALNDAGVPPATARALAESHAQLAVSVVEVLVELAEPGDELRLSHHDAWHPERAMRMAADVCRALKEAS